MTLLALLVCLMNSAPDRAQLLERARNAFDAGRYETALDLYTEAYVPKGDDAGPILYNMGVCAAALGRFAEAKAHLLGARGRLPGRRVVQEALDVVNRSLGRTAGGMEAPGASSFGQDRGLRILVCAALELLGLVLALGFRSSRKLLSAGIVLVVAALVWGGVELADEARGSGPMAVILKEEATCLADPVGGAPAVFRLAEGATVQVEAQSDRWALISWRGEAAWVRTEDVAVVR